MKSLLVSSFLGLSISSCTHGSMNGEQNANRMSETRKAQSGQDQSNMQGQGQMNEQGMQGQGRMQGMMTPEAHKQMAAMHQQVADCLESGKSKQECMQIMMNYHQKMCQKMGSGECMMMGRMLNQEENSGTKAQ